MALAVPLSRFTSRVGGGSAFIVRPLHTLMDIYWPGFAWTLGIALPFFSAGCYFWRARLASSALHRFVLSFVLAAGATPTFIAPCGRGGFAPVILFLPSCLSDPSSGVWLEVVEFFLLPVTAVAAVVFSVWSFMIFLGRSRR